MSNSSSPRRRALLLGGLSGCALVPLCCLSLFACVVIFGALDGAYWAAQPRAARAAPVAVDVSIAEEFAALPVGNAEAGADVFASAGGCHACHSIDSNAEIVGPSLLGISEHAATRRPEYSAEEYLYEAIAYPEAYAVAGFNSHIMPTGFKNRLSAQQLADVIAFLMTK